MTLSSFESRTVELAMDLLAKRQPKKSTSVRRPEINSILLELENIQHKNPALSGYLRNQIVNSITKPLAFLFFLSHNAVGEKDVVEKLADFIESHSGQELSIWYKS